MEINFTKMHGIGNDYIYINCLKETIKDLGALSIAMSPRHFSVGADGLVAICPSTSADYKMRMFNLDGSEGKMCGNAIRCVGKYLYDNHITAKQELDIETLSGIRHLSLFLKDRIVDTVTVDMGSASLKSPDIPVITDEATWIAKPLLVGDTNYDITCVSMGNPHAATFCDDIDSLDLKELGPRFEHHPLFPERVNTEFIEVLSARELRMRVWERGSGETYACGTGACAAVVASIINGYCDYDCLITVHLIGGDLKITCTKDLRVSMTGPTTRVYEGVYFYENKD